MNEVNLSNHKATLEWLFDHNSDKDNWINYIQTFNDTWDGVISGLVLNLLFKGAEGIQDKFRNLGFSLDYAFFDIKPRLWSEELIIIAEGAV